MFPETGQNGSRTIGGIEHGVTKGKCKKVTKTEHMEWNFERPGHGTFRLRKQWQFILLTELVRERKTSSLSSPVTLSLTLPLSPALCAA